MSHCVRNRVATLKKIGGSYRRLCTVGCCTMSSSSITFTFAVALLALTSGCYSCYTVTSPQPANSEQHGKRFHVNADAYDKRLLYVAISLPATNSVSFAVLPAESSLADKKKHQFSLEFEARSEGSEPFQGVFQRMYAVTAYGPTPASSQRIFSSGSYDISVAYIANGDRGVMQTPFVIHRYSVPFFIVWLGWLKEGPP